MLPFALVLDAVPLPGSDTALPTTPTVERALDLLAQSADRSQGLPVWAQVLLPLATAGVAFGVAAAGRRHDRDQRVRDDVRTELVAALALISEVHDSLLGAISATHRIEPFFDLREAVREEQLVGSGLQAAKRRLEDEAEAMRNVWSDYNRVTKRLMTQTAKLELLCPDGADVVERLNWLAGNYVAATAWVVELKVYVDFGDEPIAEDLRASLGRFADLGEERTKEFRVAAKAFVHPPPTLWQQTATTPAR